MTPRILADDARGLVIVESHWPRWALFVALGVFVGFPVVVVAATPTPPDVRPDPLVRMGLGGCMTLVFVVPYLGVLSFSRYRRTDILPGRSVAVHTIFRLFPTRTEVVQWADVERVECVCLPGRTRGIRVTLVRTDGRAVRVCGGWWSDDLAVAFEKHLGERCRVDGPWEDESKK